MAKLGFVIIGITFWALVIIGAIQDNKGLLVAGVLVGAVSIGAAVLMVLVPTGSKPDDA